MSSLLSLLIVVVIVASSAYSVMDSMSQNQESVSGVFSQLRTIQELQDLKAQQYAKVLKIPPEEFYHPNRNAMEKIDLNEANTKELIRQLLAQNKDPALQIVADTQAKDQTLTDEDILIVIQALLAQKT